MLRARRDAISGDFCLIFCGSWFEYYLMSTSSHEVNCVPQDIDVVECRNVKEDGCPK